MRALGQFVVHCPIQLRLPSLISRIYLAPHLPVEVTCPESSREVWEVASESYKSIDGRTATNRHAEITARDFIIVTGRLSSSIDSCRLSSDAGNAALADLAGASVQVGEELLKHLEQARVRNRHRLWQSFRKAVESVWSKGDIEIVAQKLRAYREQIQYHVLVSMRYQPYCESIAFTILTKIH